MEKVESESTDISLIDVWVLVIFRVIVFMTTVFVDCIFLEWVNSLFGLNSNPQSWVQGIETIIKFKKLSEPFVREKCHWRKKYDKFYVDVFI